MSVDQEFIAAIHSGWETYQNHLSAALRPLEPAQLELRLSPDLRNVGQIARHIIGARARWFYQLMGEGGEAFQAMARWDRRDAPAREAGELIAGLERTWAGMQRAMAGWSPEAWRQTWPGEDRTEPATITRHWVIWHLIEHDLHHGGEISLILGAHGLRALAL